MKTLKKSLALLLSALMLFSTFAFVVANAEGENTRVTLDIRLDAPTAGKKAPEILPVEDKKFVPGIADVLPFGSPEDIYNNFGKIPSAEEYMAYAVGDIGLEYPELEKEMAAFVSLITQMVKNGIAWIEYEEADIQALIDSGTISKEEYSRLSADYGAAPCLGYLIDYSKEYGMSIKGEDGKEYTTSARCMEPGEKFKEGKSYICLCVALADVKKEAAELRKIFESLVPYFEKKAGIDKKLETATGEEAEKLESNLSALKEEYKDKLENYDAQITAIYTKVEEAAGGGYLVPEITVNGKKTLFESEAFYASFYDFGEAEKAPTFLEQIIEFFTNLFNFDFSRIIDFIRNLFS